MTRGKIYKNKSGMLVMCTKTDATKYFEGVILSSKIQDDIVGIHSKFMNKNDYEEFSGQLTLNNLHIKE